MASHPLTLPIHRMRMCIRIRIRIHRTRGRQTSTIQPRYSVSPCSTRCTATTNPLRIHHGLLRYTAQRWTWHTYRLERLRLSFRGQLERFSRGESKDGLVQRAATS